MIEQITYLLFIRRLDDLDTLAEQKARRIGKPEPLRFGPGQQELRWSVFKNDEPGQMFAVVGEKVFPFLRALGGDGSTYGEHMKDARFTIPTPQLLSRVVDMLDGIPMEDRDTTGDLYEYLLAKIASAGVNGQFRTPRHIIKLMVEMVDPQPADEIADPAAGTAGFLVAAAEHLREQHPSVLTDAAQRKHFHHSMFHGYDFDSTMLRIGSMNMLMHGIEAPDIRYRDSLSEGASEDAEKYTLILANPPFAGSLDAESTAKDLQRVVKTKKTELLFLALFLKLLKPGGRAAVVVPDGVLFGSSTAHKELRRILVEDQKLDGIVKLPSGVFKPYAGVSTAILLFTKTNSGGTDDVWFYDVHADFYVFDFCGNLEYFSQDLPGSEGSLQKSLNQRLFETRVGLVAKLDIDVKGEPTEAPEGAGEHSEEGLRWDVARHLHATVAGMTIDNFLVRPHRQLVEEYALWPAWKKITPEAAETLAENLAGLPSGHVDSDEDAKRFDLLILRRQLAQLQSDSTAMERIRETVQQIAAGLVGKNTIPSVVAQQGLLEEVASDDWWIDVTLPMLEIARRRLRGLLQFLDKIRKEPVYIDIQDELSDAVPIDLPAFAPGIDMDRFRAKAAAYLKAHEDHLALQRLRRNKALTSDDLLALEQMLLESGAGDDKAIAKAKEDAHGLGLFIRSLVGLDRQAAMEAFGGFLDGTALGANQIHFVNLIVDELTSNGVVEPARLYEPPYTDLTARGPEALFSADQVDNIVSILDAVRANAAPDGAAGVA